MLSHQIGVLIRFKSIGVWSVSEGTEAKCSIIFLGLIMGFLTSDSVDT